MINQSKKLSILYIIFPILLFNTVSRAQPNTPECITFNKFLAKQQLERMFRNQHISDTIYLIFKSPSEVNGCNTFLWDKRIAYYLKDSINRKLANVAELYYHFKKRHNHFILDFTSIGKRQYKMEITQPSTGEQIIYYTRRKGENYKVLRIEEYVL